MRLYNYLFISLVCGALVTLSSCAGDDVDLENSIFDNSKLPQQNAFDLWLDANMRAAYNINFEYRYETMQADFRFQLSPVDFGKAVQMAQIVKFGWLEVYDRVAGLNFTRTYAPKQIALVGTPGIQGNAATLATAEQGLRVVLYRINTMNITDNFLTTSIESASYFRIMHHEFAHILHQTKIYDPSFETITADGYLSDDWTESQYTASVANQAGFVTTYARHSPDEDFAETYAIYITATESVWANMMAAAGTEGAKRINSKVNFVKAYMKEKWSIDLDTLREYVLYHASLIRTMEYEEFSQEPLD